MDLANLVIDVKDQQAQQKLTQLGGKLDSLAVKAEGVGKAFLSGWTFTKLIQGIKKAGDAFTREIRLNNLFFQNFSRNNNLAAASLRNLEKELSITNLQAKELMSNFASRLRFFEFDQTSLTNMSYALSKVASDISSAFGESIEAITESISRAMMGQTRGLNRYGFKIDTSSEQFQQKVQTFKVEGLTETQAQVKAIFEEIIRQSNQFEGATKKNLDSIGAQLENLWNSFKDDVLPKLGKINSQLFGPVIKLLTAFTSSSVGSAITSLLIQGAELVLIGRGISGLFSLFSKSLLIFKNSLNASAQAMQYLQLGGANLIGGFSQIKRAFTLNMIRRREITGLGESISNFFGTLFKFDLSKLGGAQTREFDDLSKELKKSADYTKKLNINFKEMNKSLKVSSLSSVGTTFKNVFKGIGVGLLALFKALAPILMFLSGLSAIIELINVVGNYRKAGTEGVEGEIATAKMNAIAKRGFWKELWYITGKRLLISLGLADDDLAEVEKEVLERLKKEEIEKKFKNIDFRKLFKDIPRITIFESQETLFNQLASENNVIIFELEQKLKHLRDFQKSIESGTPQELNKKLKEYMKLERVSLMNELGFLDFGGNKDYKKFVEATLNSLKMLGIRSDLTPQELQRSMMKELELLSTKFKGTEYEGKISKFISDYKRGIIDLAKTPEEMKEDVEKFLKELNLRKGLRFSKEDFKIQDDIDELKRFFSEFEMIFPDATQLTKLKETRKTLGSLGDIIYRMTYGDLKGNLSLDQQLKVYEAYKEFKNKEIQLESERLRARAEFLTENKRQLAEYYNQFTDFKNRGISGIQKNSGEAAKFYTSAYTTGLRPLYSTSFLDRENKTLDKERQQFFQSAQKDLDSIAGGIKNIKDGLFSGNFITQYNMN